MQKWPTRCAAPFFGDESGGRSLRDHDDYDDSYKERRRDTCDPYAAPSSHYAGSRSSSPAMGRTRRLGGMHDSDLPAWARSVDHHGMDDHDQHGVSVKERMKGGSQSARSTLQDAADSVQDRAKALRERLSHGTEHLSEDARARVVAAREKAHDAGEAAMGRMREGRDKAADLFEEHPMIAGALALAVGAALGAALPHTRFEDEQFGETSDELIHEAERIFAEEREKLGSALGNAVDDAVQKGAGIAGATDENAARPGGSGQGLSGPGDQTTDRSDQRNSAASPGQTGKGPTVNIPS